MCALVTGVQTCALPIYELSPNQSRRSGRIPPEDHHATWRVQSSADGGVGQPDRSWPGRKQGTGRKHHLVVRCPRECQVFHVCACLSPAVYPGGRSVVRSEEHTSELQSLMRISYAVFCLKKKKNNANL